MKCLATVVLVLLAPFVWAQPTVQTLVPQQRVTVGEAFQVQYVVYDLQQFQNLQAPDFGPHFKLVSGPAMYAGNVAVGGQNVPVLNFSFTLVPLHKGKLVIHGATAVYMHKQATSPKVFVTSNDAGVVNKNNALQPGAGSLLMVKAEVGKNECYVGEPVTATFTLLSKTVTTSEVIKNPGFYGFSVVEMPRSAATLAEGGFTGGYEKHLLRKVQLYPMQAGKLVVDEMTVHNVVQTMDAAGNTFEEEVILHSAPLDIVVKPLPAQTAKHFTGAVGQFAINAKLKNNEVMVGRTGKLQVTLSGAGNFLQLPIPEVAWPLHIEGFEPKIIENLQKHLVPVAGKKQYEYNFTADSAGHYSIPPVVLTYFDLQAKNYKTVATDSLYFTVVPQKGFETFLPNEKPKSGSPLFWAGIGGTLLAIAFITFLWVRKRKGKMVKAARPTSAAAVQTSYAEQLKSLTPSQKDFETFYRELQKIVLRFLKEDYNLAASARGSVVQQLTHAPFTQKQKETLQTILEECERVQYYKAVPDVPFTELQQKAIEVVRQLEKNRGLGTKI